MDRVEPAAVLQVLRLLDGLRVGGALQHFVAVLFEERCPNRVKSHHLRFLQLGEENSAVLAQDAGEQADLPGLLRGDEESPDVRRGRERLQLGDPGQEARRERSVGESHVRESGRLDGEPVGIGENDVFHDPLGGPHDVDRVGRLVRGDAEVLLRGIVGEEIQQYFGMEDVVLKQRLDGVDVLLRPHVLVRGEIAHDVKAAAAPEHLGEDRGREVHGIGDVVGWHVHALRGAQVAGQLGERVLVGVDHDQGRRPERQDGLDEGGPDGACAADDQDALALDPGGERRAVGLNILPKHRLRPFCHIFRYELIDISHSCTSS